MTSLKQALTIIGAGFVIYLVVSLLVAVGLILIGLGIGIVGTILAGRFGQQLTTGIIKRKSPGEPELYDDGLDALREQVRHYEQSKTRH